MSTPLTDAINALTTYSNTVTGASDTTLSDAVATLAAGYGGSGYVEPLYPAPKNILNAGSDIGYWWAYRKTDCTHVKLSFSGNTANQAFVNITNLLSSNATNGIINNMPLWFTLSNGQQAVLKFYNVVNNGGIIFRANVRNTGSDSISGFSIPDGTHTSGETVTVTQTSTVNVGCIWLGFRAGDLSSASGKTIEFDVTFTVDGNLYF